MGVFKLIVKWLPILAFVFAISFMIGWSFVEIVSSTLISEYMWFLRHLL